MRGRSGARGMGIPIPIPLGRASGGVVLLVVVGMLIFSMLDGGLPTSTDEQAPYATRDEARSGATSPRDPQGDFVSAVLASTEDVWPVVLERHGVTYVPPTLVLFDRAIRSACGFASSAVGPFYCPRDRRVYLDLSFFRDLATRFGAPGDFAQAYVVAHEVGHHVQVLLGTSQQVEERMNALPEARANQLSVRQELQADCYAGVWGHDAAQRGMLEPGDVEEGLRAAAAIGDDRLQRRTQGQVVPETFTHGTSEQRVRWFRRGLDSGDISACDTFAADAL